MTAATKIAVVALATCFGSSCGPSTGGSDAGHEDDAGSDTGLRDSGEPADSGTPDAGVALDGGDGGEQAEDAGPPVGDGGVDRWCDPEGCGCCALLYSQADVDDFVAQVDRTQFDQILLEGDTISDVSALGSLSLSVTTLSFVNTSVTESPVPANWSVQDLIMIDNALVIDIAVPTQSVMGVLQLTNNPLLEEVSIPSLTSLVELELAQNQSLCSIDIGSAASVAVCSELAAHAQQAECDGGVNATSGCM